MANPVFNERDYIGINGVGIDQLTHTHFEIWQDYLKNKYELEDKTDLIIFLPCAAIKPYYNSPIHREINKIIDKYSNIQKIVISNAGIIPYEYCNQYPFDSYDWNPLLETPEIKEEYVKITSRRIFDFFNTKNIKNNMKFISFLRDDSESLKSLKQTFEKLNLKLEIIPISGNLHETADTDLLLILKENLTKLELIIKKVLKI